MRNGDRVKLKPEAIERLKAGKANQINNAIYSWYPNLNNPYTGTIQNMEPAQSMLIGEKVVYIQEKTTIKLDQPIYYEGYHNSKKHIKDYVFTSNYVDFELLTEVPCELIKFR